MRKLRKLLSMMIAMIMLVGMIPSANAAVLNEPVEDSGVIRLIKSIRPLGTIASAMNSAAHPDDEGSSWLAALSLGQGVSCHVVTVTRGQGGQNAIGPEYHNAMGVLRTAELEEAIRVLDVTDDILREEYDSPCMDYGFSKKWEEAEEKWDFDYLVERIAYYIRLYRRRCMYIMPRMCAASMASIRQRTWFSCAPLRRRLIRRCIRSMDCRPIRCRRCMSPARRTNTP